MPLVQERLRWLTSSTVTGDSMPPWVTAKTFSAMA